ncbi:hypothetical protein EDB80DRAFT_690251 [Ilyonectria destructans]|nr:hypothetical protein EDB80DRAFT_690251 [Ilyonectria destructans]
MSSGLDWTYNPCLSCGTQTEGATYCSDSCRLSEYEKTPASIHSSSSPSTQHHTVFLNVASPRCRGIGQGREGIESVQYVIGPVEDEEESIPLKPKYLHSIRGAGTAAHN